jgi:hypothetical protein
MDFDLYHDESKENGYWHGILLVPVLQRQYLLDLLQHVRNNLEFTGVVSLKDANPNKPIRYGCTRCWVEIGAGALMQISKNGEMPAYGTGKYIFNDGNSRKREIKKLLCVIGTKFILFRERDSHSKLDDRFFPDEASKIETTFRMGLKGGVHYLGSDSNPINIVSLHFDGNEHHRRNIERERIIGRMRGLRNYFTISETALIHDKSSNHHKPENERQSIDDCQLLQLTDSLIGAFRRQLTNKPQDSISKPVKKFVEDWKMGYGRMRNSKWFQGYCLSQCYLENGSWAFEQLSYKQNDSQQIKMF